ncbi:MAG: hypothetical protein H6618_04165 [Deltaproteobacteria bacterium]|nr:hypothetical protein [Deltaproteobacteria bacterium]
MRYVRTDHPSRRISPLLLFIVILLHSGCGATPEEKNECRLQCDVGTTIPSNDMRIRLLSGDSSTESSSALELSCFDKEDSNYPAKIPVKFVIEKPRVLLPAENTTGENGPVGGSKPDATDAASWVPVSNIPFQVLLESGYTSESKNASAGNEADPYGASIATTTDLWCTDTCGVGSFEIIPYCRTGGTNSMIYKVVSGSLSQRIQLNVTQP